MQSVIKAMRSVLEESFRRKMLLAVLLSYSVQDWKFCKLIATQEALSINKK